MGSTRVRHNGETFRPLVLWLLSIPLQSSMEQRKTITNFSELLLGGFNLLVKDDESHCHGLPYYLNLVEGLFAELRTM